MELTDLQETAGLAYLDLGKQELKTVFPAFKQMLSLFDLMQNGDRAMPGAAAQADLTVKPVDTGYLRPDTVEADINSTEFMLSQAPQRDGNFIVIPNVL